MPGRNTLKRRTSILESLNKKGELSVSELSLLHNVSDVSIRNDLAHLEKKGLLIRTRGGAIKNQPINIDPNLNQRLKSNLKENWRALSILLKKVWCQTAAGSDYQLTLFKKIIVLNLKYH